MALNPMPHLNGRCVVFARIIKGTESLAAVEKVRQRMFLMFWITTLRKYFECRWQRSINLVYGIFELYSLAVTIQFSCCTPVSQIYISSSYLINKICSNDFWIDNTPHVSSVIMFSLILYCILHYSLPRTDMQQYLLSLYHPNFSTLLSLANSYFITLTS